MGQQNLVGEEIRKLIRELRGESISQVPILPRENRGRFKRRKAVTAKMRGKPKTG
jgi:hypothetical protein